MLAMTRGYPRVVGRFLLEPSNFRQERLFYALGTKPCQ